MTDGNASIGFDPAAVTDLERNNERTTCANLSFQQTSQTRWGRGQRSIYLNLVNAHWRKHNDSTCMDIGGFSQASQTCGRERQDEHAFGF